MIPVTNRHGDLTVAHRHHYTKHDPEYRAVVRVDMLETARLRLAHDIGAPQPTRLARRPLSEWPNRARIYRSVPGRCVHCHHPTGTIDPERRCRDRDRGKGLPTERCEDRTERLNYRDTLNGDAVAVGADPVPASVRDVGSLVDRDRLVWSPTEWGTDRVWIRAQFRDPEDRHTLAVTFRWGGHAFDTATVTVEPADPSDGRKPWTLDRPSLRDVVAAVEWYRLLDVVGDRWAGR